MPMAPYCQTSKGERMSVCLPPFHHFSNVAHMDEATCLRNSDSLALARGLAQASL